MQHVIFGTGPLGMSVMRDLYQRGERSIRMVNRKGIADVPAGVAVVKGDATNFDQTKAICTNAGVVYNCVNAPYHQWVMDFPPMQAGILEGAAAAGAILVSAENVYMYGATGGKPLTEDLPSVAQTRKGKVRGQMAADLLTAHHSGKVQVAIARASDFYGPGVKDSAAGAIMFGNALAGKAADVLGNPELPHTYTYIEDFGRAMVTLGQQESALGQIWHVPAAETLTTRQFISRIFQQLNREPKLRVAPKVLLRVMGFFNPAMYELIEMWYEFAEPHIVDDHKYRSAFGGHTTPLDEAICRTLEWYQQNLNQKLPNTIAAVS